MENNVCVLKKNVAEVVEKKKPLSMPVRYEVASDEVATTLPCALVERRAFGMLVMARLVVVALVMVAPVMISFVALKEVEVALVKSEFVANRFPALKAVEEAYGNCEAAAVEDEKKTPWVRMEVVVAAVEVPKVLRLPKRYAKLPVVQDCVVTTPMFEMVRHCPACVLRPEMTRLVVDAFVAVIAVVDA